MVVDNGSIVVLGGLLQDEYAGNEQKLPGLGDLPVVGRLFKSETRNRRKTNLMVFLRPVVVRDAQQTESLSMDRYDLMRSRQQGTQPQPNRLLPIEGAPALPAAPVRPARPGAATPPTSGAPAPTPAR